MTTLNKQTKNRAARMTRSLYNTGRKIIRAEERRQELVAIGKTLVPKEIPTGLLIDGVAQKKTIYVEQTILRGPRGMYGMTSRRDSFLSGKSFSQSNGGRKNRPGNKELHTEALPTNDIYNVLRPALDAAETPEAEQQVIRIAAYLGHTLAIKPKPERPVLPVIDPEKLPEIGEFTDRDPQQGAAIDHSIATGEPLFAEPQQ